MTPFLDDSAGDDSKFHSHTNDTPTATPCKSTSADISMTDTSASSDKFHQLVADLSRILGPSSGLDSDDVDVRQLNALMQAYVSDEADWSKYAFADTSRGYTRNLVDEGNGKSNLVGTGRTLFSDCDAQNVVGIP